MSFLHRLAAKRKLFLDGLDANEGDINLDIFEDFYPDKAHFVFELLQNAEDAEATEAIFTLTQDRCSFEHNGKRQFVEEHVKAITGIHNSTKRTVQDQIGKFGVGFKSVFVYCLTPYIFSKTFSFKILRLVLPEPIDSDATLGARTRFEFPFNNPKKPAAVAYEEIRDGLEQLAETTLLFLSSLQSIRWKCGQEPEGKVQRLSHSTQHIEVRKQSDGKTISSSHFLRFSTSVAGLEKQCVTIAFALDFLPTVTEFDPKKSLAKQLKIIPASPGRVAVFFPAVKETSGLRFHLHAPFVPELSRASIKETPVNEPLFQQLAELGAASLHNIRDLKLLNVEFLGVLPNPDENLPARYEPIRSAIIDEMNNQPLTPTHTKSHAPAKNLLQAKASLKELLSAEDVDFLVEYDDVPPQWAVGATQKNSNADRFLSGLDITPWDIAEFLLGLEAKATLRIWKKPDEDFIEWLTAKPVEWHQRMYSLLYKELSPDGELDRLTPLQIIRLADGSYSVGSTCYFPNGDEDEHDKILPRVAVGTYTAGKSKTQQAEARKLLEKVGVREVGDAEEIEVLLKKRYISDAVILSEKTYLKHLKRFIALVEHEPRHATLFAAYYIFESVDEMWEKPTDVFLDTPIGETGLTAYYEARGGEAPKAALARKYAQLGISLSQLRTFAEAVGVQKELTVGDFYCCSNPDWSALQSGAVKKSSNDSYRREDSDFDIPEFETLALLQNIEASRLSWRTMTTVVTPEHLVAIYRRNNESPERRAPSSLVHCLNKAAWVPQTDGQFVRPSQALRQLLPEGFPFDAGQEWLKAIGFGQEERQRSEEHIQKQTAAETSGFSDAETLERALKFAAIPKSEQERILAEFHGKQQPDLPEHEPRNPDRRADRVAQQASDAPERMTEERLRSVAVGQADVKQQAAQYLREQYTKDGEMICQVCLASLPFKLDDGNYYFEKVEFLQDLEKWHIQNYLALCPNHSAMFQHANGSRELMKTIFSELDGNKLEVVLAQRDAVIYFTQTHIADLKKIIEVDGRPASLDEPRR